MNLGALLALFKLAQDAGMITGPSKPIAKKITLSVVPLTYEQYKDIPTGEKKLGRPGLRPPGL